jgi:ethanolamine permease
VNPSSSPQPKHESLQAGALGWTRVAGLGVAIAVSGQFSGWNYGLAAGGWGGLVAAALCTGLFYLGFTQCVAELSAAMPSAGGFETYCRRAFGNVAGYMVGMSVLVALSIAIGVVADFTAAYAKSLFGISLWGSKLVLFGGVLVLQLRGAREAVGVTMWVGAIAIAALLLFCASMAPFAQVAHLLSHDGGGFFPHGFAGVFAALPYALWLYLAVEQAALAAEETADPGKTIPKALAVAVLTLLASGLSVLLFAPAGGGVDQIGGADDPLLAALTSPLAYGHHNWITGIIGAGALVGLIATFFSVVYASSRQLYSLSRDHYLPKWLSITNRKQAPHTALLVVIAIGFVASLFAPERGMLLVIFPLSLSYLMVLGAYLRLRRREPDMPRPYQAVGGTLTACATTAISLLVLGACVAGEPLGIMYALAVYSLLLAYFVLFQRSKLRQIQVNPS